MVADYANDIALLANTLAQAESLLHSREQAACGIDFHVNADKTEYMCFTQSDNNLHTKWWLSETSGQVHLPRKQRLIFQKWHQHVTSEGMDSYRSYGSQTSDKIKHNFFQAAVVSILLYGCTTWTLTEEKRLDGNCTRILRALFNKYWKQHPTKQLLYLPTISKTIQIRGTRHAGHCWKNKSEFISDPFTRTRKSRMAS